MESSWRLNVALLGLSPPWEWWGSVNRQCQYAARLYTPIPFQGVPCEWVLGVEVLGVGQFAYLGLPVTDMVLLPVLPLACPRFPGPYAGLVWPD